MRAATKCLSAPHSERRAGAWFNNCYWIAPSFRLLAAFWVSRLRNMGFTACSILGPTFRHSGCFLLLWIFARTSPFSSPWRWLFLEWHLRLDLPPACTLQLQTSH